MLTKSRRSDVLRTDGVLFVERANELAVYGKAKGVISGAVAKASANSAF